MEIEVIFIISLRPNAPSKPICANNFLAFAFVFLLAFKLSIVAGIKRFSEAINTFSLLTATFLGQLTPFESEHCNHQNMKDGQYCVAAYGADSSVSVDALDDCTVELSTVFPGI